MPNCQRHPILASASDHAWADYIAAWRQADLQLGEDVEQLGYRAEAEGWAGSDRHLQSIAAIVETSRAALRPRWDAYMRLAHQHVALHGVR